MKQPMTAKELRDRLGNGEDALGLSIEAWDRRAHWIRAGGNREKTNGSVSTCGLCVEVNYAPGKYDICYNKCRYGKFYSEPCHHDDRSALNEFSNLLEDLLTHNDVLACAAEEMRDRLIAIKKGAKHDE